MPSVSRVGPFRFFSYSNEGQEAPHVHIESGRKRAKFWLAPARLASSRGFKPHEVKAIQRIVFDRELELGEAWDEHFSGGAAVSDSGLG
jgi:hypothetical protein